MMNTMTLLANLLSADPKKNSAAYRSVRKLHDLKQLSQLAEHRDEIRAHARTLALDTSQSEDAATLEFVLHKLEHVKKSQECLCALYLIDDLFDPADEARHGNVRILDTVRAGSAIDYYECQCTHCGTRYQVEENEYYRTWWAWRLTRKNQTSGLTLRLTKTPSSQHAVA